MRIVPVEEAERLADLQRLGIVGTEAEPHFDAVCRLARDLFAVPIVTITFIDADHQWHKAACGLDRASGPRETAFCARTILSDEPLVIPDAAKDPNFADNPLVVGSPGIRFYAGVPLALRPGLRLGTLCLIDTVPRTFPTEQVRRLQDLAEIVLAHLRLHEAVQIQAVRLAERERITQDLTAANQSLVDRSAAILVQLAEGVIVADASGRITLVNGAAAAIHGVARLDVEPDAYSDTYHLFTEDGRPYPPQDLPLARAVRGETVRDARWRIRRPDGVEIVAVGSAQPLLDAGGVLTGAVLTVRDDTARAEAERRLLDLNASLAQRVAERTQEAETARELAEAGSRAKSEFVAAMSHEVRTPLHGVLGYADLLSEERALSSGARLSVERIRGAGKALLTVVNDILDFSKIEAGQMHIAPRPFAPVALIDNTVSIVRRSAEAKGLTLGVSIDPVVPAWLLGDEDRLRQVLLNLLNNAVKFTARGRIDLGVAVDAMATDAVHLRCSVRDTGIGIPADKRDRLFQRFSQVDSSIKRDYGGSGLGLAISKALIERMGGVIGVASEAGRGSTFWFTLDLSIATEPMIAAEPLSTRSTRSGRRLLLAEDVPLNQDLAKAILERAGHSVDVVGDGAAAIAAVQASAYDVVLMDVQMPGMDGMSATRHIRTLDGAAARVPIIAMTANVLPEQVAEFRTAGMDDHVGKPFRQEALLAAIDRWTSDGTRTAQTPGLDRSVYDEMHDMIGHERMVGLLEMLADELMSRFGPSSLTHDRNQVAADAHAMISAASMVGFASLADLCREVEAACRSGEGHEPLVELLRIRSAESITEIMAIRAA